MLRLNLEQTCILWTLLKFRGVVVQSMLTRREIDIGFVSLSYEETSLTGFSFAGKNILLGLPELFMSLMVTVRSSAHEPL
jgi:hypothetical protein